MLHDNRPGRSGVKLHGPETDHTGPYRALNDARGIFCGYVCDGCETRRRAEFRVEIFEDASYEADDLGDEGEE